MRVFHKRSMNATNRVPLLACLIASTMTLLIAGCGKNERSSGKLELEVAVFQGGYGLDFFERAARQYEKAHPNVKIKIWGNPRIWEQLRPRFVAGDPPDLAWPGWGMDVWSLVAENQVLEVDRYLETKAYGQSKKWKDTYLPSMLDNGKYNGHYYLMPYNYNVFGWWYNASLFAKHNWSPPKSYEELLALCDKIKRTGIAPITFQGKYPDYMVRGFLIPWAISVGGVQAYIDAENLKPGAWNSPAFLKAAEMVSELRNRGYFQKGAMGMDHTSAQMEFVLGRAAMIPCGTWLGSEMKNQVPPGFRMAFFNPPVLHGAEEDQSIVSTHAECWIIPRQGKHPDVAADFFKFMSSLKLAREFVATKHTLMSVAGSDAKLSPDLSTAARLASSAKAAWDTHYREWYPSFGDAVETAVAALLNGESTPKQCVDQIEQAAEKLRNDKSVLRHKI